MADDTLTFALGGRVELSDFEQGVTAFRRLVSALTGKTGVTWLIDDLQPGSAVVTLRGEAEDPARVQKVILDYGNVGLRLERGEALQYKKRVMDAARVIRAIAGSFEYVRFETPENDYTVYGNGRARTQRPLTISIGAVTGRVQTLSNRGGLRFNLYDAVHDKAVACYLQQGQEEFMREAWGRRARVSGRVSRESESGRPVAIRNILDVKILEEIAPGSYRVARGAIPWTAGNKTPEEIIRQLRDA